MRSLEYNVKDALSPQMVFCVQFPTINDFGEDRNSYCSFEPKDTALLQSENDNLQQRINILTHEVRGDVYDAAQHFLVCLFIHFLAEAVTVEPISWFNQIYVLSPCS